VSKETEKMVSLNEEKKSEVKEAKEQKEK